MKEKNIKSFQSEKLNAEESKNLVGGVDIKIITNSTPKKEKEKEKEQAVEITVSIEETDTITF